MARGDRPIRSVEIACTIDLFSTFAELAQCELPARVIDGNPSGDGGDSATTPHGRSITTIVTVAGGRSGKWKLFLPLQDYSRHPHFKQQPHVGPLLFDLMKDIACQKDVAAENPEVVRRLEAYAEKARTELGDRGHAGAGMRQRGHVQNPTAQVLPSTR